MLNNLRKPLKPLLELIATPFTIFHPNFISFLSIIISLPGFYFFSQGKALLGSLFIIGNLLDTIDGTVARMKKIDSPFGGILDATIDRFSEGLLFLSIAYGGLVRWEIAFALYITSVLISYIKAKAEAVTSEKTLGTNKFSVGIMGRGERIGLIFLGSVIQHFVDYNFLESLFILMLFLTLITVFWRGFIIYQETNKISK